MVPASWIGNAHAANPATPRARKVGSTLNMTEAGGLAAQYLQVRAAE
jgi:hypothetical protein